MHTTTTTDTTTTAAATTGSPGPDGEGGLYGWSVDGEPCTGRLTRYATDRALSFYAGIPIGPLYHLDVTDDGALQLTPADLRRRWTRSDAWVRVCLQVGTDTATYRIDLRT